MQRKCGECQLCCELLPVRELSKPAGQICTHQSPFDGCTIYCTRPNSCRQWSCMWLADAKANLPRPDECHYVIDIMPDFIGLQFPDGRPPEKVPCAQVWVHPEHRDAHKCEKLRAWLDSKNIPAIIRYSAKDGFVLVPPSACGEREWLEVPGSAWAEHTPEEIAKTLAASGFQMSIRVHKERRFKAQRARARI